MSRETGKDQLVIWKHREVLAYAVAFVRAGLWLAYVGSDDVPDEDQPVSPGVAGSAIAMLRNAHVLNDYHGSHLEEGVHHGRRRSKRPSRNGAKINLYWIRRASGETFLRRHGAVVGSRQKEMAL